MRQGQLLADRLAALTLQRLGSQAAAYRLETEFEAHADQVRADRQAVKELQRLLDMNEQRDPEAA